MTLCIVVADGARPETLFGAIDSGALPALARVRAEGAAHAITTVFPSVTGSAYAPFLMGLHPGRAGLPGLRWYDRSRRATLWPAHARSYVGIGGMRADRDLTREHPTLFELEPRSLGGFTYIGRGLSGARRIGRGAGFAARMAWTHFRADLDGWMRFDRWLGEEFARRVRAQRPRVAFLAHPGVDKLSHRYGQGDPRVLDALRTVDGTVARLYADAEADGRLGELEIWVVSDHGHSDVQRHEDLHGWFAGRGYSVKSHPLVLSGRDVGLMVSGNKMAQIYFGLENREKPGWRALESRWATVLEELLALESVDLAILPVAPGVAELRDARGSRAELRRDAHGRLAYSPASGDPLGLGGPAGNLTRDEAWARTRASDYPDAIEQIIAIADAARSGDVILSAAPGHDFRARWEPSLHASGHGALRRDQMLVPLLTSRRVRGAPRRTTDVFPSALAALEIPIPAGLDGESFL